MRPRAESDPSPADRCRLTLCLGQPPVLQSLYTIHFTFDLDKRRPKIKQPAQWREWEMSIQENPKRWLSAAANQVDERINRRSLNTVCSHHHLRRRDMEFCTGDSDISLPHRLSEWIRGIPGPGAAGKFAPIPSVKSARTMGGVLCLGLDFSHNAWCNTCKTNPNSLICISYAQKPGRTWKDKLYIYCILFQWALDASTSILRSARPR